MAVLVSVIFFIGEVRSYHQEKIINKDVQEFQDEKKFLILNILGILEKNLGA